MQKKVTITINEDINILWGEVAKKHNMSKSGMVEEFLGQVLPILSEKTPSKMMSKAMKEMASQIDSTASLFDSMELRKMES